MNHYITFPWSFHPLSHFVVVHFLCKKSRFLIFAHRMLWRWPCSAVLVLTCSHPQSLGNTDHILRGCDQWPTLDSPWQSTNQRKSNQEQSSTKNANPYVTAQRVRGNCAGSHTTHWGVTAWDWVKRLSPVPKAEDVISGCGYNPW